MTFAKETSNSISYCKERNLHFIVTFLHEKRAEPLALVHTLEEMVDFKLHIFKEDHDNSSHFTT
jgi:hypothetical protein